MNDVFYITTTLPYVNSDPHIGFVLELVQADAIARFARMQGREVIFNTGTDEHGQKIYQKAIEAGVSPQEYCDDYAARFRKLQEAFHITNTHFTRTTDPAHISAAQEFWRRCRDAGYIDKKQYDVKYCVGCELEKTDSELENGVCPLHPNLTIEHIAEENYFFKFSAFAEQLLSLYEMRPDFVLPDFRLKEIRNFVQGGLEDFSISRLSSKMPWGIPVPDDEEHVMYVWFDALINYISVLGWPSESTDYATYWPGIQIAGKDNLRQQSAMWQAMLLAADLPVSKQIIIHGFITSEGQKMSKSLGNVVDPYALVKEYGVDAVRYYLLAEIPTFDDGDFSDHRFKEVYNADLANGIGNHASRVTKLAEGMKLQNTEKPVLFDDVQEAMKRYESNHALAALRERLVQMSRELDADQPWMIKDVQEKEVVMQKHLRSLFEYAHALSLFLPHTATQISDALTDESIAKVPSLFARL